MLLVLAVAVVALVATATAAATARRRRPPQTMLESLRGEDGQAIIDGRTVPGPEEVEITADKVAVQDDSEDSVYSVARVLQIVRVTVFVGAIVGVIAWALLGENGITSHPAVKQYLSKGSPLLRCERPSPSNLLYHYGNLAGFSFPIYNENPVVQRLFSLGLLQQWNYDVAESRAIFDAAADFAPQTAMLHFGRAYSAGVGANRAYVATPQLYPSVALSEIPGIRRLAKLGYNVAQHNAAKAPTSEVAKRDVELTGALYLKRYANGSEASLDTAHAAELAYAQRLAELGQQWRHAGVLAMAAESYMNLFPWDYYHQAEGKMKPLAEVAEGLIDQALSIDSFHPLALHLHVHIAEAASTQRQPGKGRKSVHRSVGSADILHMSQGPWWHDMGHLQHMPSHTYITVGRWSDAVDANINASVADSNTVHDCMRPYEPEHNTQMLIYAANMAGRFGDARHYAAEIRTYARMYAPELLEAFGSQWTELVLTLVQQGRWGDVMQDLGLGPPKGARGMCPGVHGDKYVKAVHLFARALAVLAKAAGMKQAGADEESVWGYVNGGRKLAEQLQELARDFAPEEGTVPGAWPGLYACDYANLTYILSLTAAARLAVSHSDFKAAQAALEEAVGIEDSLGYMEPPRQYQPVRHCLGYVHLLAEDNSAAEQVFKADLSHHLSNGRALLGLSQSLTAQGKAQEAVEAYAQYDLAWHGDTLASPCLAFSEIVSGDSAKWGRRRTFL